MLQANPDLVRALLIGVVVLSLVLIMLVAAFKVRRDLAEARGSRFRRDVLEAWRTDDHPRSQQLLRHAMRSSNQRQIDLLAACHTAASADWSSPDGCDRVRATGRAAGVPQVLRAQLRSRRAARRGLAVVLGGYPVGQLEPDDLVGFTADGNATVRLAAAASLERLASPASARALIGALVEGTLPSPRLIERLGHAWAVPSLLTALGESTDERVRCDLLRALALTADPRALPTAIDAVASGSDEERIQAMRVLAEVSRGGDPAARQAAVEAARRLVDDPQPNVRTQAIAVLRHAPAGSELDVIEHLAHDADWFVRRAAAQALAGCGEPGRLALQRIALGADRFAADRAREELALLGARETASRSVTP